MDFHCIIFNKINYQLSVICNMCTCSLGLTSHPACAALCRVCYSSSRGVCNFVCDCVFLYTLHIATYDADYTLESTELEIMFVSGQTQYYYNKQCRSITILDDSILESNKSFALSLTTNHPAMTGTIQNTTVVILEDISDCMFIICTNHCNRHFNDLCVYPSNRI